MIHQRGLLLLLLLLGLSSTDAQRCGSRMPVLQMLPVSIQNPADTGNGNIPSKCCFHVITAPSNRLCSKFTRFKMSGNTTEVRAGQPCQIPNVTFYDLSAQTQAKELAKYCPSRPPVDAICFTGNEGEVCSFSDGTDDSDIHFEVHVKAYLKATHG